MRIVIAGAGKLGFSIAQLLAEDQFDVVVVEIDPKRKDVIQNTLDVLAIEGNSCSPTTFADPDISASDVLIACTDSDEVNMVTCLMAKNHGIKHTVARIRNVDYAIHSPEMLKKMSDDEVNAAIAADLHEDAYARQAVEKTPFRGKRLAEGLERSLYICPSCERVGTLRGQGNEFSCDCGLRAVYDEYGYLNGAPYATVTLWDAWQREKLKSIAGSLEEAPAFQDPAVRLYQVTDHHTSKALYKGPAAMYRDRLALGSFIFPIADISDMAVYGKANVAWTCGDAHYELKADPPFCGRKYTELYQILKKNR